MFESNRLFPTICSVVSETASYSATRQRIAGQWAAAAGLPSTLRCRISPLTGREKPQAGSPETVATHKVAFQNVYAISPKMRLTVASGPFAGAYDVVRSDADGGGLHSILEVLQVK